MAEHFSSEQHPISRRWAVFEDDGDSAWLYLTEAGGTQPVSSCFIYNRTDGLTAISDEDVTFRWSADGESVALLLGPSALGFIVRGERLGYSKKLSAAGELGAVFDDDIFTRTFHAI